MTLKRWVVGIIVGVTFLIGLSSCVVAPVVPVPSGYVVTPPAVVIRPYPPYNPYRAYRPYRGWYPHGYRW